MFPDVKAAEAENIRLQNNRMENFPVRIKKGISAPHECADTFFIITTPTEKLRFL